MLEAMATLILVIVVVVLIIFILGYGIYITFYPLTKTVKGGFDAMKEHVEEERGVKKGYTRTAKGPVLRTRKGGQRKSQKKKGKTRTKKV